MIEIVLVTVSLVIGFLYGGITGFILVLSPTYISKKSYKLLLGLILLIALGEHLMLALAVAFDAFYILVRTINSMSDDE